MNETTLETTAAEAADAAAGIPAEASALRHRELIAEVAQRAGLSPKAARPVVAAALAVMGEALAEGRAVNLPGLGRGKVTRVKSAAQGTVVTLRLKQPPAAASAADPLAEDGE